MNKTKSYNISKQTVVEAFRRVKANGGASGVDQMFHSGREQLGKEDDAANDPNMANSVKVRKETGRSVQDV